MLNFIFKSKPSSILENSPNKDEEFIIVPKVVGENADN